MRSPRWSPFVPAALGLLLLTACGPKQAPAPPPQELTAQDKVRMAESYRTGGRMNDALELLAETVDEDPDNAHLHTIYGEFLFMAGRYEPAVERLTKALELDPYLTEARTWLGVTYTELGHFNEAREQYERALQDPAYPTPQNIYLNLGLLYRAEGRDRDSINQLRQAVAIDPKFYQGHFELAAGLEVVGEFDEAVAELAVAEPAFRMDGEYWYRRGFLHFRLGRTHRARESLLRCIDVAPGSPAAAKARELMSTMGD